MKLTVAIDAVKKENTNELQNFLNNLEYNSINQVKTVIAINKKINPMDLNYDKKNVKLIKYSGDYNSAKIWNDLVENYIHTDFVLIGNGISRIISKYTKYERLVKILDEIPNMEVV